MGYLIGAVIGDIVGSRFEFKNEKTRDFELFTWDDCFTDDTVMTLSVAKGIMDHYRDGISLQRTAKNAMANIGYWYPHAGYGRRFYKWIYEEQVPYFSCGNGAAMRVSPVGFAARSLDEAESMAYDVTLVSHNHPEGIKGAQATAAAIFLAREGKSKEEIREYIEETYYPEIKSVEEYHKETNGHGKELCQISCPQAFAAFFEGNDYESVIRNCIYIGGDTDTTAAIAGGMAEAMYGVPDEIKDMGLRYLDSMLKDIYLDWKIFMAKRSLNNSNMNFCEEFEDA